MLGRLVVCGLAALGFPALGSPALGSSPLGGPALAAPARVVSMNLCTDQLAMLLAAPGQLVSVSDLATDPRSSPMVEAAAGYPVNHGLAEEVFLLDPDLVLAGSFTTTATVAMLRRLGVPVLVVPPVFSIAEARAQIVEVGAALGRPAEAAALVRDLDAALAVPAAPGPRPTAAIVGASFYAAGPQSLAGEVLDAAGFDNVVASLGLGSGGWVSLEELLMRDPDLLVLPESYPGWSRAEELLHHPALAARGGAALVLPDRNWVCGTPALVANLDALVAARQAMAP